MKKNESLLKSASYFWSNAINAFIFGHGPMIVTLAYVHMLTGLRIATTKIGTYNWGGMWSTEIQHVLWKACKNFDNFFSIFSRIFWQFWWNQALFGSAPNGVKKLLKKFQIFRINERKVMPVLPKVSQGMFSGRHNTAAAVRAKRPETLTPITGSSLWLTAVDIRLIPIDEYRPDLPRGSR